MASMLSRGAILAECLVKNSTPKVTEIYSFCNCAKELFKILTKGRVLIEEKWLSCVMNTNTHTIY